MKLLIDIQIFIWWDSTPTKLPSQTNDALKINRIVMSVASIWEIQIKLQIGKLELRRPLAEIIIDQQSRSNFEILPVLADHVYALQQLPLHHKDPFDRLIIAQALVEGITVVSVDSIFSRYPVTLLD